MTLANENLRLRKVTLTTILATLFVSALLTSKILMYSTVSFLNLDHLFTSEKLLHGVMGSKQFFTSRQGLARQELNLGAWHSFNKLELNIEKLPVSRIEFDFLVSPGGILNFTFFRRAGKEALLRLSEAPEFPSAFITASVDGEFISKNSIRAQPLLGTWHHIVATRAQAHVTFKIDEGGNAKEMSFDLRALGLPQAQESGIQLNRFAVRNGSADVHLKNLIMKDGQGRPLLVESFSHNQGEAYCWLVFSGTFILLLLLIFGLRSLIGPIHHDFLFTMVAVQVSFVAVLAGFYFWDFNYFSSTYPYRENVPAQRQESSFLLVQTQFENWRSFTTNWVARLIDPRLVPEFRIPPSPDLDLYVRWFSSVVRFGKGTSPGQFELIAQDQPLPHDASSTRKIAFVGGSQTWGEGVVNPADTWVGQFYRNIAQVQPIVVYNLGSKAFDMGRILKNYMSVWKDVRPDDLIINVGHNDKDSTELLRNFSSLVRFARAQGSKIYYMHEANSRDGNHYLKMEEVSELLDHEMNAANNFTIGLNEFLNSDEVYDSGFLWYDQVHLTAYAQKLVGHFVAQEWLKHQGY